MLKEIEQLSAIQAFLDGAPEHLVAQGRLRCSVQEYRRIHYLLVARDHWRWVEPHEGIAIVELEAFVRALGQADDLHEAITQVLTYDWLPVEGRDFSVRHDWATVNGVSLESQVFYASAPA